MIKRLHYPIEQAAEILKTTTDNLIHYAAWRSDCGLPIYVLTAQFVCISIHVDKNGALDEYPPINTLKVCKLSMQCLQELEAGNCEAEATLERSPYYEWDFSGDVLSLDFLYEPAPCNGYLFHGIRRRNIDYPLLYEFRPRRPFYPEPIKISECKMVVLSKDLERYQQGRTETTKNQAAPNGHEERHAKTEKRC